MTAQSAFQSWLVTSALILVGCVALAFGIALAVVALLPARDREE